MDFAIAFLLLARIVVCPSSVKKTRKWTRAGRTAVTWGSRPAAEDDTRLHQSKGSKNGNVPLPCGVLAIISTRESP